jgi:hypothetical protein
MGNQARNTFAWYFSSSKNLISSKEFLKKGTKQKAQLLKRFDKILKLYYNYPIFSLSSNMKKEAEHELTQAGLLE